MEVLETEGKRLVERVKASQIIVAMAKLEASQLGNVSSDAAYQQVNSTNDGKWYDFNE